MSYLSVVHKETQKQHRSTHHPHQRKIILLNNNPEAVLQIKTHRTRRILCTALSGKGLKRLKPSSAHFSHQVLKQLLFLSLSLYSLSSQHRGMQRKPHFRLAIQKHIPLHVGRTWLAQTEQNLPRCHPDMLFWRIRRILWQLC
jgi:hypothetical protein